MLAIRNRTTTYILNVAVCYLICCLLSAINALQFVQFDYIPLFTINSFIYMEIIVFILVAAWREKDSTFTQVYSFLKRYRDTILGAFFILEIITYLKVGRVYEIACAYIIVYYFYWILLDSVLNKSFDYSFEDRNTMSSYYSERPVVGKEYLTKNQRDALELLINAVDKRDCVDSINIALIGEWGTGKTSITDTFIKELVDRNTSLCALPKYFVLMINTQVINNAKSIIEYVEKYISHLFRKYGVTLSDEESGVAFLIMMSDMLGGTKPVSSFHSMIKLNTGGFIDVEQERMAFAKNIQTLLKISNRKNIIFVIDNVDRVKSNDHILKMLSEFSSIDGLISIVSLDPECDQRSQTCVNHSDIIKPESLAAYKEIDKYIHVRVKVEKLEKIEYEKSLSEQIMEASKGIICNRIAGIRFNGNYSFSIYADNEIEYFEQENNHTFWNSGHSILTELFFKNLEKSEMSFGDYLEDLVMQHFCNTNELSKYINVHLFSEEGVFNNRNNDLKSLMVTAQWVRIPGDDNLEWTGDLLGKIQGLVSAFDIVIGGLENLNKEDRSVKESVRNCKDVYIYELNKKAPGSINKDKVGYCSGVDEFDVFVLSENEIKVLDCYIEGLVYEKAIELLMNKLGFVINLYLRLIVLVDFVRFMRKCLSNYRCFKMQLRECELYNCNYLDYLMRQWEMDGFTKDATENYLSFYYKRKEIDEVNYPSINKIVNCLLLEKYILDYGRNYRAGELGECTAYLRGSNAEERILIESFKNENKEIYLLDIHGKRINSDNKSDDIQRSIY